jgi:hypothetical protein
MYRLKKQGCGVQKTPQAFFEHHIPLYIEMIQ